MDDNTAPRPDTVSKVTETAAAVGREAQGRAAEVGKQAQARTADVAGNARDRAADVAGSASDRVADLTGRARDSAAELAQSAKDRAGEQGETQKARAADSAEAIAGEAHRTADRLRESDQRWLSDLVDRGAEELNSFADVLRSNDLNGLLGRMQDFARRQPALFTGASVAAGFALARLARVAAAQSLGDAPSPPRREAANGGEPRSETRWHDGDGRAADGGRLGTDGQSRAETTYPGMPANG